MKQKLGLCWYESREVLKLHMHVKQRKTMVPKLSIGNTLKSFTGYKNRENTEWWPLNYCFHTQTFTAIPQHVIQLLFIVTNLGPRGGWNCKKKIIINILKQSTLWSHQFIWLGVTIQSVSDEMVNASRFISHLEDQGTYTPTQHLGRVYHNPGLPKEMGEPMNHQCRLWAASG